MFDVSRYARSLIVARYGTNAAPVPCSDYDCIHRVALGRPPVIVAFLTCKFKEPPHLPAVGACRVEELGRDGDYRVYRLVCEGPVYDPGLELAWAVHGLSLQYEEAGNGRAPVCAKLMVVYEGGPG